MKNVAKHEIDFIEGEDYLKHGKKQGRVSLQSLRSVSIKDNAMDVIS